MDITTHLNIEPCPTVQSVVTVVTVVTVIDFWIFLDIVQCIVQCIEMCSNLSSQKVSALCNYPRVFAVKP